MIEGAQTLHVLANQQPWGVRDNTETDRHILEFPTLSLSLLLITTVSLSVRGCGQRYLVLHAHPQLVHFREVQKNKINGIGDGAIFGADMNTR